MLAYNGFGRAVARIEADLEGFALDLRELLLGTRHRPRPRTPEKAGCTMAFGRLERTRGAEP